VLPSLAVLPFKEPGGNAYLDDLANGIVEDIITALSRFVSLTASTS
jgi:TolB-like protein